MRFALIDNKLVAAAPGAKGLCPGCFQPVTAKCGIHRIYHWAHITTDTCDSWSEGETPWHRAWKNNFPIEWQERFLTDQQTGEKHIADIRTPQGLVIEFQHSPLNSQERIAREAFYKNMVWVVDSSRLKRDYPRFLKEVNNFRAIRKGIFRVGLVEQCFPATWIASSVPVIFDFKGVDSLVDMKDLRSNVYCLFPDRLGTDGVVAVLTRKAFIDAVINGKLTLWIANYTNNIRQVDQELQSQIVKQQHLQDSINFQRFSNAMQYRRGRRRYR